MKKAIILGVLLVLLIAAGVSEHYFVHKTFDEFNGRLKELETAIDTENLEAALEQTKNLDSWWEKKRSILEVISYCPDMRQINVIIGEMQGSLEYEDFQNASSKVISLLKLIDNIEDILDFNAKDVI